MNTTKCMLIVAVASMLCACDPVLTREPMGETPLVLDDSWEGTWVHQDGWFITRIEDGEKGVLQLAWVEGGGNRRLELDSSDAHLRLAGDHMFASMKIYESSYKDHYYWGRIRKGEDQILVWEPDFEAFKRLVSEKKLPGKIDGDVVILGELTADHMAIITGPPGTAPFDWEDPGVAIRISENYDSQR